MAHSCCRTTIFFVRLVYLLRLFLSLENNAAAEEYTTATSPFKQQEREQIVVSKKGHGMSTRFAGSVASGTLHTSRQRSGWLRGINTSVISSSRSSSSCSSSKSARVRALSFLSAVVSPPLKEVPWSPSQREHVPTRPAHVVDRGHCRPAARAAPLRFSISKPSTTGLDLAPIGTATAPATSAAAADKGTNTGGVGCGGGEGGMGSRFTWLDSVNSTMDEVKDLIVNQQGSGESGVFAVAAREQLRGRGTKGRAWIGLPGNVFLTVAIPLDRVPVPLSLIPLRVGTLIAPEIQRRLRPRESPASVDEERQDHSSSLEPGTDSSNPRVSLKWPNDVLLGGAKVAGVLIEAELPFLLVGIGVNVRHKPEVPQQGPDRGRPAACLAEFGAGATDEAVRELSAALTERLRSWASGEDSAQAALAEWSGWVDWSLPLEIRDERREVTPVGVAPDGRLRVVDPGTGKEELLTTEYLL